MSEGSRPGERHARLARLITATVLTEAASGPYVVTRVIAALAGADVVAVTADSRYGRAVDVRRDTLDLADMAGVRSSIERSPSTSDRSFSRPQM